VVAVVEVAKVLVGGDVHLHFEEASYRKLLLLLLGVALWSTTKL